MGKEKEEESLRYPKFMAQANRIGGYIAGAIVFGSSALAVMESILRKVFSSPTTWSMNLTQGVFIWASFLGSSWAFQELGHVTIDLFRDALEKNKPAGERSKTRRVLAVIGYLISFVVVAVILYGGWQLCGRAIQYDQMAPYNFKFPLIISYASIVVGSVMMLLTLIFIILDLLAGGDKYL